jgi:hypothetical protein
LNLLTLDGGAIVALVALIAMCVFALAKAPR